MILAAEHVLDAEGVEPVDAALRLFIKRTQVGAGDLVAPLNLLHEQLGVGHHSKALVFVAESPREGSEEGGVFSDVVGGLADEFAQFGELLPVGPFDHDAIAGGPGIAARAAIAICCDPVRGRVLAREQAAALRKHKASLAEGHGCVRLRNAGIQSRAGPAGAEGREPGL